jgi:hypothetical protein
MSYLLTELRAVETEELVARHDAAAENTSVGVNYYLDELARRDAHAQSERMVKLNEKMVTLNAEMVDLTRTIRGLTVAVAILTVVNLAAVLLLA